ncbi:MAG: dolichol kinase [Candidatus Kapaibacterium sp.]
MSEQREISYTQEILRKGIHLVSLAIPLIYIHVDRITAIWVLVPMTLVFFLTDVLSHRSGFVRDIVLKYFGSMMREHERRSDKLLLNGATYVLFSACLCVILLPKVIAVTAFTILIISDISAALIGRKFGKHKFLDKSLEGTLAFIVSSFVVVYCIGRYCNAPVSFYISGCIAGVVGGIVENISIRLHMDDNFSIPASIGIVMVVLAWTVFTQQPSYLTLLM